PEYRYGASLNFYDPGRRLGNWADKQKALSQALTLQEKLAQDFPLVPAYHNALAATLQDLAFQLREGQPDQAVSYFRRAINHQKRACELEPKNPKYREHLFTQYCLWVEAVLRVEGHAEAAPAAAEMAIALEHWRGTKPWRDPFEAARLTA